MLWVCRPLSLNGKEQHQTNLQDLKEHALINEYVGRGLCSVNCPSPPLPLGLLAVFDAYDTSDKETKQGETPGAASDLNRLEKDLIYVGGLPHSKAVR